MSELLEIAGISVSPDHYINGQRLSSDRYFDLHSPIDQRLLGRIAEGSDAHVEQAVARLRRHTDLPISIGFGIRTPDQAAAIARLADGVVVGSALIDQIANAETSEQAVKGVLGLCRELSEGVRGARG